MSDTQTERSTIPDGWTLSTPRSGFARLIGPYYLWSGNWDDGRGRLEIGLAVDERHGGRAGHGHGAVLLTLLDEVMGRAASLAQGVVCVTVSLQTSFCAGFHESDFLRASASICRKGRTHVFLEGRVMAGEKTIATGNGVWHSTKQPLPPDPAR